MMGFFWCIEKYIIKQKGVFMNNEIIIPIGKTEKGNELICDLVKAPHVFIGGKTASGKSVFLHNTINHLIKNYLKE